MVLAEVTQANVVGKMLLNQLAGGGREQHLTAMPGVAEAGRAMDVQADVVGADEGRITAVETDADLDLTTLRPRMRDDGALGRDGRRQGVGGAREDGEDAVTTVLNLVTPLPERVA